MNEPRRPRRALVCDDDEGRAKGWAEKLQSMRAVSEQFEFQLLQKRDFLAAMPELERRRQVAQSKAGEDHWVETELDKTELLLVDYDLFGFDEQHYVTGENVAYLARCYSRCGLIVALNQYPEGFDLRLRGHPESYADLNLSSGQVAFDGLWSEPWSGFRPWHWPILPKAVDAFRARSREVEDQLDEAILDVLGIDSSLAASLPAPALAFLEGATDPARTTFAQFVENSGNGLRGKDRPASAAATARIAAARITKWLERLVLPGQDVLVDAPHLVARYPSLLHGEYAAREAWNATTTILGDSGAHLRSELIAEYRFRATNWLSRTAWFGDAISSSPTVADISSPWSAEPAPFVFCEDISSFLPLEEAREFSAELTSVHSLRYVADPSAVADERLREVLGTIEYRPRVQFAL